MRTDKERWKKRMTNETNYRHTNINTPINMLIVNCKTQNKNKQKYISTTYSYVYVQKH